MTRRTLFSSLAVAPVAAVAASDHAGNTGAELTELVQGEPIKPLLTSGLGQYAASNKSKKNVIAFAVHIDTTQAVAAMDELETRMQKMQEQFLFISEGLPEDFK